MLVVLLSAACQSEGTTDSTPTVASVLVTSPIGGLMAVGRTVQLQATARDGSGVTVPGVGFQWSSSNPSVATVSGSGLVSAQAAGSATITATADGVDGDLAMQALDVNLAGIAAVIDDPFTDALASRLSASRRPHMEAALNECSAAAAAGAISGLVSCIADARAEANAATDPNDRALAAVIRLMIDHADRLLSL
jgi:hypothetical protein